MLSMGSNNLPAAGWILFFFGDLQFTFSNIYLFTYLFIFFWFNKRPLLAQQCFELLNTVI